MQAIRHILAFVALAVAAAIILPADETPESPRHALSGPVVEVEGTVSRVQVQRGRGMPFLEMEIGGETVKVYLGSMRYLMQNNFNPQAGEKVTVEGYRWEDEVVASRVNLPARDKELRLRDKDGRPLWQSGRYGQGWGRGRNRSVRK